jgi:hypothetical protein
LRDVGDVDDAFLSTYLSLFKDKPPLRLPWLVIVSALDPKRAQILDSSYKSLQLKDEITVAALAAKYGHLRLLKQHMENMGITGVRSQEDSVHGG